MHAHLHIDIPRGDTMTNPPPPPGDPAVSVPPPIDGNVAPAPKAKPHVLSVIAFVVAIVGFVFACIPGALIVGWILLPIAFVLSLVALFMKGGKWPAVAGLVLAIVGTIVGVVVFLTVVQAAVDETFGSSDTSVSPPAGDQPTLEASAAEDVAASNYAVTIDSATQGVDYEGRPALIVNFTFTNNSKKDANFMFATSVKAFQDGVELETAIGVDGSDLSNSMKDLKPGASLAVQDAFVLTSTTDVTIEVTELISFKDTMLATTTISVQ